MVRKAQPRTGKMFRCSNPKCKMGENGKRKMFYAAPSRATIIERDSVGYCCPECKYIGKRKPLSKCPICQENKVKPGNIFCGIKCAHVDQRGRKKGMTEEEALAVGGGNASVN